MKRALFAALFVLTFARGVNAEPLASIQNPRVKNGTWVADANGALRAETVARLNQTLTEVERTSGIEMAVVVVRSLDGLTVEDAAEKLFKLWGIGKKDKDNGLLFLWSTGDRKVRIEVGYGLEGVLPDGKVGAILDAAVIPHFKAGDFDAGVIGGVEMVLAAARNEPIDLLPPAAEKSYERTGLMSDPAPAGPLSWIPSWVPFLGVIPVGLFAMSAFRKWRRYRQRTCPKCRAGMSLIPDTQDEAYLNKGQAAEERVGSVDYDIWQCPSCAHRIELRYAKWLSKYDKCPQCFNRTRSSTETVLAAATRRGDGLAKVVEECAFCTFKTEYTKVLPRITESPSSSSSGSSSSGSSSSFGGGSSGGGGASRGY